MFYEKKVEKMMNKIYTKIKKTKKQKKLRDVNLNRFRISVSKSLNNLSAQIIDDKLKKHSFQHLQMKKR